MAERAADIRSALPSAFATLLHPSCLRSPRDLPLEQVVPYNPHKDENERMRSLVLSGHELLAMTESQWQQTLAVS